MPEQPSVDLGAAAGAGGGGGRGVTLPVALGGWSAGAETRQREACPLRPGPCGDQAEGQQLLDPVPEVQRCPLFAELSAVGARRVPAETAVPGTCARLVRRASRPSRLVRNTADRVRALSALFLFCDKEMVTWLIRGPRGPSWLNTISR